MKGDVVQYRKGYKYSLWVTYQVQIGTTPVTAALLGHTVKHRLFELTPDGLLTIHEDYPWDGASGPTWDTKSAIRASLVHDALCEMMRLGLLPQSCFHAANQEFYKILLEDEMWRLRAKIWFNAVEDFAGPAAMVQAPKVYTAP